MTINKGTGVSTIYYKINGASSYTSSTSNVSLSVNSGSTYYFYGVASSGYTMLSCTSLSPCSGIMTVDSAGSGSIILLSASESSFTVAIIVDGGNEYEDVATVAAGESYTTQFATMTDSITVSCTNNQVAYWKIKSYVATFTISSVTADTVCNIEWDY